MKWMKKHFYFPVLVLLLLIACNRPRPTGFEFEKLDTFGDPDQRLIAASEPIVIASNDGTFALTPRAEYRLSGVVVSRAGYSDGWDSILSPVDLAVAWGKAADPQVEKYVSFSQSGRWYYYRPDRDSPIDLNYIATHSGNNHLIPCNENLTRAVKSIRRKETICLEGFLVDVKGTYKGGPVVWSTSLTRTDTGNGSCEVFYVTKARIEGRVYE
jgi:hypothetical protein